MSADRPAGARTTTSTGGAKTSSTGTRAFARRAQALRGQARRRQTSRPSGQSRLSRLGEVLRRIPRAAWICAAIACINAVCWSILMPPFQIPDEPTHFAYAQQLAENARMPTSNKSTYSQDEETVLSDVHQYEVRQTPERHPISTEAEQQRLNQDLADHLSRHGEGGVGGSYSDPPLYYLLETVPYGLASSGTLLDQLEAMRLLSALLAGIAALFTYLFIREALPGTPWAWTVGALGVALAPLFGFIAGAVNPGSMLVAVSAAILYALARGFRRGLTPKLTIAIGAMTALGFLTSLNFVGLAPGILLGLVLLAIRAWRVGGRRAYLYLGIALAIAAAPVGLYVLHNLLVGHPVFGVVSSTVTFKSAHGSLLEKISYVWQLYLPRLPGMNDYFPGLSTTRRLWFDRGVGYYGWLDTSFPTWVDNVALVAAAAVTLLGVRALAVGRAALRLRAAEVVVYCTIALGLLLLIGVASNLYTSSEGVFAEPRYLLPLLPLVGLGLALAARGAGRRWGPAAGTAIVILFLGHDIFSQLLVVARYYG
jgi:hypothetical protein